jgi:mono/diheme cytochrome c family protein
VPLPEPEAPADGADSGLTELFLGAPSAAAPEEASSSAPRALASPAVAASPAEPGAIDFAAEIQPLLSARCVECHGPTKVKGDLRLDSLERILHAEPEYWVVIPGRPAESLLLERVRLPDGDRDRMPPKGERLTAAEVELLERWIAGLPSDAGRPLGAGSAPAPAETGPSRSDRDAAELLGASASELEPADVAGSAVLVSEFAPSPAGADPSASAAPLPPADAAALELWRQRGARALELAEGDGALELCLSRTGQAFERAWLGDLSRLAPQLVWLDLSGLPIEDGDLVHLAALVQLEHLRLDGSRVSSAGLEHLAALPRLQRLNLCSTQVDDSGLARFRSGFAALESLYLWASSVGPEAAAALASARPGLRLGPVADPAQIPAAEPTAPPAATAGG